MTGVLLAVGGIYAASIQALGYYRGAGVCMLITNVIVIGYGLVYP